MGMFFEHRDYPGMTLDSLNGFEEDAGAAKAFERRFQPAIVGGVAVIVLGFSAFGLLALHAQQRGHTTSTDRYGWLAFGSFVLGFVTCMMGCRCMSESVPISPRSGQPMQPYRLEDSIKEGKYEVVYVCRASRTYFRRVYSEKHGG
jgi:hypothetical protein